MVFLLLIVSPVFVIFVVLKCKFTMRLTSGTSTNLVIDQKVRDIVSYATSV